MVVRASSEPATAEEAAALRQLVDCGTEHSRASLLELLRTCGGDVDVAMSQLWAVNEPAGSGDHMEPFGSTEYIIDGDVAAAPADDVAFAEEDEDGVEYGGRYGSSPAATSSDEDDGEKKDVMSSAALAAAPGGDAAAAAAHEEEELSERPYYEASLAADAYTDVGAASSWGRRQRYSVVCGGVATDPATGLPMFINDGIAVVNPDIGGVGDDDGAATTTTGMLGDDGLVTVSIDLAVLDEDAFQTLLDDWLLDGVDCVDDAVLDGGMMDDGREDSYDYGAGGEVKPSSAMLRAAPVTRSDPREFRAYLDALLAEDPEARAKRIEQERLDEFLAQQIYLDDLKEFEKEEERKFRTQPQQRTSGDGVAVEPVGGAGGFVDAEAWAEMERACRMAARERGREEGSATAARREAQRPRLLPKGILQAAHTAPARTVNSVTVNVAQNQAARRGNYTGRQVHLVLPKSCRVVAVQNITNRALERRFAAAATELRKLGYATRVDIAYHGTDATTTNLIAQGGFIAPAGLSFGGHRSGNTGFYGNGIYLSPSPATAQGYASGGRLLVCNVLRGNPYKCPSLMMGSELKTGYSSHESSDGREWVFFSAAQILPVAIVHFGAQSVAYPRVLAPLVVEGRPYADPTEFNLARQRARQAQASRDFRTNYIAYSRQVAAVPKGPAPHVSNRERKMLNRAAKGQQQAGAARKYRR